MPDNEISCLGAVVLSCSGRDSGRYFVVVELCEDDDYVMIADGALRKMEKPKKKKKKHLKSKGVKIPVMRERLEGSKRVYDYEIRSHLEALGYNR